MDARPAARLAWHQRRQRGLFTRSQAVEAGYATSTIDRRLVTGVWERWYDGVYGPAGLPAGFHTQLMAAYLKVGADAVVAGLSAARLWGLPDCDRTEVIELAVPRTRAPNLPGGAVVRGYPWLLREHTSQLGPFCVLTGSHVVADLAHRFGVGRTLNAAADRWRQSRGGSPEDLAEVLAVRGPFAGAATLRAVIQRLHPDYARTRSVAEIRGLRAVLDSGLPRPRINVRLRMSSGRRWEFDKVWDDDRAIVEIDGDAYHYTPEQRRRDALKDADARADGWLLKRIPAKVTEDPDAYLAIVALHLAEAADRVASGPASGA